MSRTFPAVVETLPVNLDHELGLIVGVVDTVPSRERGLLLEDGAAVGDLTDVRVDSLFGVVVEGLGVLVGPVLREGVVLFVGHIPLSDGSVVNLHFVGQFAHQPPHERVLADLALLNSIHN